MPGGNSQCQHEWKIFKVYVDGLGRTVYVYQCKKCDKFYEEIV